MRQIRSLTSASDKSTSTFSNLLTFNLCTSQPHSTTNQPTNLPDHKPNQLKSVPLPKRIMESRLILSKNVDKSTDQQTKVTEIMLNQPDNYLAILLQDCPSSGPALSPNYINLRVARHTASLDKLTTNTTMIINTDKCLIAKITNIGTYQAAGQIAKIYLTENGYETNKVLSIVNIYIRPRASYQETNRLLKEIERLSEGKFSRVLIAGDFNATSASWDPENLRNAHREDTYRAFYETKILKGRTIDYFNSRHGLAALPQNTKKPRLLCELGKVQRTDQTKPGLDRRSPSRQQSSQNLARNPGVRRKRPRDHKTPQDHHDSKHRKPTKPAI